MVFRVCKRTLHELIRKCPEPSTKDLKQKRIEFIIAELHLRDTYSETEVDKIVSKLSKQFYRTYHTYWKACGRNKDTFENRHREFLDQEFIVELDLPQNADVPVQPMEVDNPIVENDGAAKKEPVRDREARSGNFSLSSTRRRSLAILQDFNKSEISGAFGRCHSIRIPPSGLNYHDMELYNGVTLALSMCLDLGLSVNKYETLRSYLQDYVKNKVFPGKDVVQQIKKESFPRVMNITDEGASTHLYALLENTFKKLLIHALPRAEWEDQAKDPLILVGKLGMDGASNQQTTRQRYSTGNNDAMRVNDLEFSTDEETDSCDPEESDDSWAEEFIVLEDEDSSRTPRLKKKPAEKSDQSVFCFTFVPLQLKDSRRILWTNPKPSSVHYCRPLKFKFVKEQEEFVTRKYDYYMKLLNKIENFEFELDGVNFTLQTDIRFTMIDGKICNWLTGQKYSRACNVCGVKPEKGTESTILITVLHVSVMKETINSAYPHCIAGYDFFNMY